MLSIRIVGFRMVLAGLAVLTALFFGSCGDGGVLGTSDSYPTFSLVGAPDRSLTYEYAISGPGMLPVTGRIAENETRVVVEVPAGPDRLIEILSVDDVYSGRTTADIAPGATTHVTVRLYPGPVFVDYLGQQIVQIRDMSGVGQRSVGEPDLDVTTMFRPVDAAYDGTGALWVPTYDYGYGELYRFSDLSSDKLEFEDFVPNSGGPMAVAVDSAAEWLYCAIGYAGENVDIERYGFDGTPDFQWPLNNLGIPISATFVSGMTVDSNGYLHVVAADLDQGMAGLLTFNGATGALVGDFVPLPGGVPAEYMHMDGPPPIGDIRAVGEDLFVVSAISEPGQPVIFRYNLQLELQDSWGVRTESDTPSAGQFWGPRRFVATRNPSQLIVIDQRDGDFGSSGSGRLVEFRYGTVDGWRVFGDTGEFEFFETGPPMT